MKRILIFIFLLTAISKFSFGQYKDVTIETPNETEVDALKLRWPNWLYDLSNSEKEDYKNFWLDYYDNRIEFKSEATLKYNCHAYAWYVSEGGEQVWINTPNDDIFWNDGSYVEVGSETEATKISFGNCYGYHCFDYNKNGQYEINECGYQDACDHSAITASSQGYFISKWGAGPRFKHHKNDCPYSQDAGLKYYVCMEYIEDLTITSNYSKTSDCKILIKNVSMENNVDVTIDGSRDVLIEYPFNVEKGVILKIN